MRNTTAGTNGLMDFPGRTLQQRSKQVFYLKETPVALVGEWEGESERKNASNDCVFKQVSPAGDWSTALLDNSRSQSKMYTSKLSRLRDDGGRIVRHQPVRHWLRLPQCSIYSLTHPARQCLSHWSILNELMVRICPKCTEMVVHHCWLAISAGPGPQR